MKLINLEQIRSILGNTNLVETIETGFVAYLQDQITMANLTGVAVQDIQIAKAIYQLSSHN